MRVLLDINVVLDVLLDRRPWVAGAMELWQACDDDRATGYLSAISLPTIFYVVRKSAGIVKAREAIGVCLDAFEVCAVDGGVLKVAHAMTGPDFEDNVQIASAIAEGIDAIVSRDPKGLANDRIPVREAGEIVKLLPKS
jgi:predicted nucleic acid-binding protein